MEPNVSQKIAFFFEQYPVRKFKKGQILIHAGDDPESILKLESGKIKKYDLTYRGDEVVLNVFKPPAFFPMSFAINRTPNEYFYEADSDVELRKAPFEKVITFVQENPDVLYDLLARVYRGTDGVLRRMVHLMSSTAKSRVLYEVLIECKRFGIDKNGVFEIELNESDIGARAGLSRETVNREMHKLKEEGLIKVVSKHIQVPDIKRLEAILGQEL
jgi:CRP/FNR family transcriptional regulator, cyclic AMP receptor protein